MKKGNNLESEDEVRARVKAQVNQEIELSARYKRLFNTDDGKAVIMDLNGQFLVNAIAEGANHSYWAGAKTVMTYILQHQQKGASNAYIRDDS